MRRAALVLVIAVAGCTSEGPPAAAPSPSAPPATASPTAATLTREAAAAQYLQLSAPANAVRDAMRKKCETDYKHLAEGGDSFKTESQILANLKDCDRQMATAWREWTTKVRAAKWPAEVQPDLDKLVKQNEAQAYAYERAAGARDVDAYLKAVQAMPQDDGSADIVRARLGLPTRSPS